MRPLHIPELRLKRPVKAYAIGTGLPVQLPPGRHWWQRIRGTIVIDGLYRLASTSKWPHKHGLLLMCPFLSTACTDENTVDGCNVSDEPECDYLSIREE